MISTGKKYHSVSSSDANVKSVSDCNTPQIRENLHDKPIPFNRVTVCIFQHVLYTQEQQPI